MSNSWNQDNNRRKLLFALGCMIGAILYLVIYGADTLRFTNDIWLLHSDDLEGSIDLTQHYLGWMFYRRTPWAFPFGLTQGIYWENVSVVFTDSIPLFAVFFKLLSPLLPETFQYFGLFGLCCYTFMGGFGALLLCRFCEGWSLPLLAALLFCLSPVMLNRMYLHTALSAHFLLVAALVLWAYAGEMSQRKKITHWSLLAVVGTLINAYFTPMILGTMLCSLLQEVLAGKKIRKILLPMMIPVVTLLLSGYIVGMFYGQVPASGGGLDILSFNLDAFSNPMTYLSHYGKRTFTPDEFVAFNYSSFLPSLPLYTTYQNEGFAYLGLGILLLWVLLVSLLILKVVRGKIKEDKRAWYAWLPVAIYLIVFLLLALSPRWTLGERELLYLSYPDVIVRCLSIFRSTGRFIWPVYYMLLAGAIILLSKIIKNSRWTVIILAVVTIIQVADLYPGVEQKHEAFSNVTPYESRLSEEAWDYLGEHADSIVFYPPTLQGLYYDCKTSMEFEIFALKHDLDLNMTYMSRDLTSLADEKTYQHFEERKEGLRDSDRIYIFLDCAVEELPEEKIYGLHYYQIDGYIVGTEQDLDRFVTPGGIGLVGDKRDNE